ncbi:MotE family protein [Virgibacillus litoralis]|uniref:Flagellar motility protein MotE (MotC chaperone) n=1 Tax=Virgibacillus litoralis TaxID=578221 RepID=A0ABS4HDY6_9BACI|nr:flagellar motility protein MotE (MotC chaperone) [Virgibacillus litoralis]
MKDNKKQQNKTNPILWFFFAIIIPFIVAVTLTIIIFTVAGVDVIGWAKSTGNSIPVVSSMITTDKEKNEQREEQKTKNIIATKDEKISQLNQKVSNLESTVGQLEQEIIKLENSNSNENKSQSETSDDEAESGKDSIKAISSSFKEMDSEQAALIIESMEQDLAVGILKKLPNDVRGRIFEEMEPDLAAELTQLFVTN